MTRDVEILTQWIRVVVIIAAICTNAVPVLYAFSPWRTSALGKLFMLQAVTLAVALDVGVIFMIWIPTDILIIFWVYAIIYTTLSVATGSLAVFIWKMNFKGKRRFTMLFNDNLYQILKKVTQVGLPGLATLYFTLAAIWGLPYAESVVGTIAALTTFLGLLLGLSSKTYHESEKRFGGTLKVTDGEDGSTISIKDLDHVAILDDDEITFKIVKT